MQFRAHPGYLTTSLIMEVSKLSSLSMNFNILDLEKDQYIKLFFMKGRKEFQFKDQQIFLYIYRNLFVYWKFAILGT